MLPLGPPPWKPEGNHGFLTAMAKRAATSPDSRTGPVLVHLLHGEDEVALGRARTELIEQLVAEEMRAENVTEIAPRPNQALRLKSCLADILDELSTASFFPEHRRVVVVHDLQELCAKPTKEVEPLVERLAQFLRRDLPEVGNAVVFVVPEEADRWKRVQKTGVLFKTIAEIGSVREFGVENLNFAFQDALLARNAGECLRILDRRLEQARSADQLGVLRALFSEVVRLTRLLIEAKILARSKETPQELFPDDKRLNLLLQHQFVQKKVRAAAASFRVPALVSLREELARANRHFAPSLEDAYVADQRLLLEHFILRLCAQESPLP